MSKWRQKLEEWLGEIDVQEDRVLDVGGGERLARGRTKTWNVGKDYLTLDKEGGDIEFNLDKDRSPSIGVFGVVFCLETLMYCADPVLAVRHLSRFTRSGGILYLSNPLEGYPETRPFGMDMIRLMPHWYVRVFSKYGLEIRDMRIVCPSDSSGFTKAVSSEGYKVERLHASGILIEAERV